MNNGLAPKYFAAITDSPVSVFKSTLFLVAAQLKQIKFCMVRQPFIDCEGCLFQL